MTNNLGKTGKTLAALLAIAALFALSFPISSCKNFMKSDEDVKEQMQQEVDVANAPEVSVRVQSSSDSLGSVTPNGPTTFKVNVPSNILSSELAGGFIRWATFYSGDPTVEVSDAVTFADPKAKETTATVLANRSDIIIQAMFEKRPTSTSHFPSGTTFINTPITITFNKPINPASLTTTVEGVSVPTITLSENYYGTVTDITTTKYAAPTLNTAGTVLTYMNTVNIEKNSTVYVTIAKTLTDTSGLTMADDFTFPFSVGESEDKEIPVISAIIGGMTNLYLFPAAAVERRIGRSPIYLKITGGDNSNVVIKAKLKTTHSVYADNGDLVMGYPNAPKEINWSSGAVLETSLTDAELISASGAQDGLIKIVITIFDGNLNESLEYPYLVVRDTTAPSSDQPQRDRIVIGGATAGSYYNSASTLNLSQKPSDPVIDAGCGREDLSIPRLNSKNVYYRFTLNPAGFTDANSGWVISTSNVSIPVSISGVADGLNVNVWGQFRDDLGNTSSPVAVKTINVDSTPPTGSVAYDFDQSNGIWVYNTVSNVPFVLAPSDNLSGVAWYYVSESPTPPNGGTSWVPFIASNPKGTITFSDASEGTKTCYVWFKDNADNVSTAPATAVLVRDTQAPTVSKFILRAKTDVAVSGNDPQTPSGTQFSNNSVYYFAFVTNDIGAAGLDSFTFTEGSATSDPIPFAINPGTQGTGAVSVSNVTVANTASGTLVMGSLTVSSTTQGEKSVWLKVKDKAGNGMTPGIRNEPSTNRCIYDSLVPTVSSVSISPSSGSFHVYNPTASTFYTNDGSNTVVVTGTDGTGDVSGLKCVNLGAITTGAFSSLPSTGSFVSTTATIPITLNTAGDGQKFLSLAAEDNAGNIAPAQTINLYYDSLSPSVNMDILDANGYSLGNLPVGSNDVIMVPTGANVLTTFKVRYTANDNLSGLQNSDSFRIYKRSGGTDTISSVSVPSATGVDSAAIPIPDSMRSATYIVYLSVSDKVQNVTTKKYGFFYDAKDPVIATSGAASAVRVQLGTTGSTVANYLTIGSDNYFVVPVMAFPGAETDGTPDAAYTNYPLYVYLQATDKPVDDPDGSGIASIQDAVTRKTTSGTDITEPTVISTSAESSESAVADRYVLLKSHSTDYWNFAPNASISFTPTVKDAIGRSASTTVRVLVDDTLPSATVTGMTPWVQGYDPSVYYISNTAALDFTPNDLSPNSRPASGLKGYSFGTSETLPAAGDPWTLASGGTAIPGNTAFRSFVPTGTPANVYLYLCDKAGNRSKTQLSPGKLKRDMTAPTFSAANVVVKDADGNSGYVSGSKVFVPTSTFTVNATANDRDVDTTGSGIDRFVFYSQKTAVGGAVSPITYAVTADKQDGNSVLVHPTMQTDLSSIVSLQFYIEAVDKVELTSASATGFGDANAPTVSMDNTAPEFGSCTTDGVVSGAINVSDTTILTMPALDSADTDGRPASGIKAWYLSYSTVKPSAPTGAVLPSSAITGPAINTWYAWTGGASQAIPAAFKQIVTEGSSAYIYAFTVDNVGNVSSYHDVSEAKYFVKDSTPPGVDITTATKFAGGTGGTGNFVKGDAKITFNGFDANSGLYQYLISSATYTTGAEISADSNVQDYAAKTNMDVHGYFSASSATTVYLYVSDKAGNLTKVPIVRTSDGAYSNTGLSPTGAVAAQLDMVAPNVTSVSLNDGDVYDNDKIVSVRINLDTEDSSGVKTIVLSHSSLSTDAASITVMANGATAYSVSLCDTSVAGKITITLAQPCTESGYITVSGVKVTSLEGESPAIIAQVIDAATNGPSAAKNDSITFDTQPPTIGTLTLVDPTETTTGWTNTDTVNLTIPQSDSVSRVRSIEVSGGGFSSLTGATYTVGGSSVTPSSVTGGIIQFSSAILSVSAVKITGLVLTSGSGKKDITVKLTDVAGNPSSVSPVSIDYDDTAPATPGVVIGGTGTYQSGNTYYLSGLDATITLSGAEAVNGDFASGWDHYYYTIGTNPAQTAIASGSLTVFDAGDSAGTTHVYHFSQLDKAGNPSGSKDITFIKDATAPAITSSLVAPTAGNIGVYGSAYYAQGAKITIAANDPSSGSGIASYAISTASTAAGVTSGNSLNTGGNGRTNWNGALTEVTFTSIMTGSSLYFYVWDNLGNVTSATPVVYSTYGGLAWNTDTSPPATISLDPSGTSGAGWYQTNSSSPQAYDANAPMTFTLKGSDAHEVTCSISGSGATLGSSSQSGNEYTWSTVTIPANGTEYTITLTDGLGNSTTKTVKVTLDKTPPSFGSWSMSNSGSVISLSNVVTSVSDVASELVDGGTVAPSNALANLAYDSMHKISLTDRVGNVHTAYFVGVYEGSTNVVLRIDDSPHWTITNGSTDTTISDLGIYRNVSNKGTLTSTCIDAATSTATGTVDVGNSRITGFPLTHASYYTLTLSYASTKQISFNFSVSGSAASPHAMIFGNPLIAGRISDATVISTIRRDSFERARSSSKTNLPVWYSEVGASSPSAKTERTGSAAVTANKSIVKTLATPARADKTLSVEALHAAALSGMKATNGVAPRATEEIAKTVQANETENFDDTVVMTAPEGSPAFVAYARGLAALRGEQNGCDAVARDRASFTISEGEKPVTVWEKLLAFFGIEKNKSGMGVVMN